MPENLIVRLNAERVEWLLFDEHTDIVRLTGNGDFDEFVSLIQDVSWEGEMRVLLTGENALLTRARVPSRQQRQILQAVPYAVEEELASNVDDCHFATGNRGSSDEMEVVVIDRAYLTSVLDNLSGAGLIPDVVTVDLLLVPGAKGTNILIDRERAHLLKADNTGFTTTIGQLPLVVSLLDEQDRAQLQIHLHADSRADSQLCLSEIQASEPDVLQHELDYTAFETLCRGFRKDTINLLQGDFKAEQPKSAGRHSWRAAAILAGCTFLAHILLTLGQGVYLAERASGYAGEAAILYQEVFPGDRNVRDMRRRWRSHLGGRQAGTGLFLPLFTQVATKISESTLVLQNVNYHESRGDLILQLLAARSELLVLFVESLASTGIQAEIATISQQESSVRGSVKIKSGGGG